MVSLFLSARENRQKQTNFDGSVIFDARKNIKNNIPLSLAAFSGRWIYIVLFLAARGNPSKNNTTLFSMGSQMHPNNLN
jgi:hypothetical protein